MMRPGASLRVESTGRNDEDPRPAAGSQLRDLVELGRRIETLGDPHLTHLAPPGIEQLQDGLATLDLLSPELAAVSLARGCTPARPG